MDADGIKAAGVEGTGSTGVAGWARRRALWLGAGGLVTATAALAGCGPNQAGGPGAQQAGGPASSAGSGAPAIPGKFREAPQLATLVKDGKLPPVEQRLPKEPAVLKPVERTGQYGGQWRMTTTGRADGALFTRVVGYDGLVRWSPDWKGLEPGLASRWEVNADATAFTFYLREGLKWSDGKPVTADDFIFCLEDVVKNPELVPVFPSWLLANGKQPTIARLSESAFTYQFAAPNGLFLQNLATPSGLTIFQPAHWMKQWHKKYGPEGTISAELGKQQKLIEEEAKRRGLQSDYATFYTVMSDQWFAPDLPTVNAWKVTRGVGDGQRVIFDRNPYYWKVDTDGNQLPYIDQIVAEHHEKVETMVLKALGGEVDMQDRHFGTFANKSTFFDGQQRGNYKFFDTTAGGGPVIALNLTHKDPELRKVFQDIRFRQALSHAINRKEAIDLIYVGQGEPAQPAPDKGSAFHHEKLRSQYLEYNPARANQLLDEMGLRQKDSRGMRLRPDGKPLFIAGEVAASSTESVDYLQVVKKYWGAVGVDMDPKVEDRSIFYTRKEANEHDLAVWGGGNDTGFTVVLDPRWYFPFSHESNFAVPWARWFQTNGQQGEEPPEATRRQVALYLQLLSTGDEKKQVELMKQILDIAAEQFYVIGLSTTPRGYGIVRNDFHNVPKDIIGSWQYPNPGPVNPSQFFTTRR